MERKDTFRMFLPISLLKGDKGKDGVQKMRIGGIASTGSKDADGEYIDPNGADLSELSFFNWHHQWKKDPSTIIGEVEKGVRTKNGEIYVEGELYEKSDVAKKVYNLAKTLEESGSKRKLGFSIEGQALERDIANPKKILKSKFTQVAITPLPKNKDTVCKLIKGEIDHSEYELEVKGANKLFRVDKDLNIFEEDVKEEDQEKALEAGSESGAAISKESLLGSLKRLKNLRNKTKLKTLLTKLKMNQEERMNKAIETLEGLLENDLSKGDGEFQKLGASVQSANGDLAAFSSRLDSMEKGLEKIDSLEKGLEKLQGQLSAVLDYLSKADEEDDEDEENEEEKGGMKKGADAGNLFSGDDKEEDDFMTFEELEKAMSDTIESRFADLEARLDNIGSEEIPPKSVAAKNRFEDPLTKAEGGGADSRVLHAFRDKEVILNILEKGVESKELNPNDMMRLELGNAYTKEAVAYLQKNNVQLTQG